MTDTAETTGPAREEPLPDVPPRIREAARAAPGHWFGMVDPAWRGEGAPPEWAVVGRYRSDAGGEVVEWLYNDDYRPSPSARGWPEPTDPVDEAIQLAVTGYGAETEVFRLLAGARVAVLPTPDGRTVTTLSPDGDAVVPVFTSVAQADSSGRFATRTVTVADLVRDLTEDVPLYVNPAGAVSMIVEPDRLVPADEGVPGDAVVETETAGERETEKRVESGAAVPVPDEQPATGVTGATTGATQSRAPMEPCPVDSVADGATAQTTQDYLVSILTGGSDDGTR
ncbi:type VII secretion system-associated protein [Streptomyces sp. NPDC048718]|uniref:type VII secretion system-associated protein n=1 Tax=Streptomyces sp. NPDC048718 TaxID=3365587 RepID=UPI00371C7DC0